MSTLARGPAPEWETIGSRVSVSYDELTLRDLHSEYLATGAQLEVSVGQVLEFGIARDLLTVDVIVPIVAGLSTDRRIDALDRLMSVRGWDDDFPHVVNTLRRFSRIRNLMAHAQHSLLSDVASEAGVAKTVTFSTMRKGQWRSESFTRAELVGVWRAGRGAQSELDFLMIRAVPLEYWGIKTRR